MSSSSDTALRTAALPDLRSGVWTRLGDDRVLGDAVTEAALGQLAERTREAARAQGYVNGWSEGRRSARARADELAAEAAAAAVTRERRRDEEHRVAVEALASAAAQLMGAVEEICSRVSEQASDLALEATRALVGHELATSTDPGADVVRRVLASLPLDPVARVRLHPDLAGSPAAAALAEHGLPVVGDPALDAGDAIVETDLSAVDLRVSTALARLAEVLR